MPTPAPVLAGLSRGFLGGGWSGVASLAEPSEARTNRGAASEGVPYRACRGAAVKESRGDRRPRRRPRPDGMEQPGDRRRPVS